MSRIEHLPQDVLDNFAPILLGNYAPRLLLFTTPSYDFNTRFRAPDDEKWGIPDPTGRTNRTFRHPDHKFEWTVDECVQWCKAAAQEWGYEVIVDAIGRSITEDPWGRDNDTVRATQAVTFRRREGDEWATRRATRYAEWVSRAKDTTTHKLLATHQYEAHTNAQKPVSREDITAAVKATIQDIGASNVTIFELWREDAVSTACGGWLEVLVDVMDKDESFVLHREAKDADDWKVEALGVELRGRNPWQSTFKRDDAWGECSESTEDEDDYGEYDEEYDGDHWEETDSGWVASESEGWETDGSDINTLKAWQEWKPAPGWVMEGSWD